MRLGGPLSPLVAAVSCIGVTLTFATHTAHSNHVPAQGGWPPPIEMSQHSSETSKGPVMGMAQNGDLHLIWTQPEPGGVTFTVHHASSNDHGGDWAYTAPLTSAVGDRYSAAMDVDEYGLLHAVWVQGAAADQLWYGQLSGDTWQDVAMIPEITPPVFTPDVVATADFVHTAWYAYGPTGFQFDIFYSRSEAGGAWITPTTVAETPYSSLSPKVAADQAGNVHLVWQEYAAPPQIYYISGTAYTTETIWSKPITLSEGLTQMATTPDIVVSSDNTVHVVFGVNVKNQLYVQDIYYASFPITDSGVVSATLIPNSRVKVSQLLPTYASPAVAVFGDDQIHVAWNGWKAGDNWDSDRIYYAVSEDAGLSWSAPVAISPKDSRPDGFPSLAADDDFVHTVWLEKVPPTDQDLYYAKRFPVRSSMPLGLKEF